tara:strand:+ start:690 stop:1055 length:366 start_codon:yes stop_codon:yes gene_type:complete
VDGFMSLREELDRLKVQLLLISADPPERNRRFWQEKRGVPWPLLSDEDHAVADRFELPIARKHPMALNYQDGFIQPAVFAYKGEEELFRFVNEVRFTTLWGAAGRPSPEQVLAEIRPQLEG